MPREDSPHTRYRQRTVRRSGGSDVMGVPTEVGTPEGASAPSGLNSVPTRTYGDRPSGPIRPEAAVLAGRRPRPRELVSVPPLSHPRETFAHDGMFWERQT